VHRRAGALDDGLYYRLVIAAGASPPGPGSVVARAWPVGFCACSAWRAGGLAILALGPPGSGVSHRRVPADPPARPAPPRLV